MLPCSAHPVLLPFVILSDTMLQIPELAQPFNFPLGGSRPTTLVFLFALCCTPPSSIVSFLRCRGPGSTHISRFACTTPLGKGKMTCLDSSSNLYGSLQYFMGFFSCHCTSRQRFQIPVNNETKIS